MNSTHNHPRSRVNGHAASIGSKPSPHGLACVLDGLVLDARLPTAAAELSPRAHDATRPLHGDTGQPNRRYQSPAAAAVYGRVQPRAGEAALDVILSFVGCLTASHTRHLAGQADGLAYSDGLQR